MPPHPAPTPLPHAGFASGAELWLARHAQVHADHRGLAYGDMDVPLSAAGELESCQLALRLAELAPLRVISSPLTRARHLGEHVAEALGQELLIEPRLAEIQRGNWQGQAVEQLPADDVAAFYADPWSWRGHGGESDQMLSQRLWPVLEQALAHPAPGRLLLTTHYNVIRVLVAGALGLPPAKSFRLRVDPARLVVLRDAPGGWQLLHSNLSLHTPTQPQA